jgi:hypothetical protein
VELVHRPATGSIASIASGEVSATEAVEAFVAAAVTQRRALNALEGHSPPPAASGHAR